MTYDKIICWWSGGVTSAVACKIAINLYGSNKCSVIMIDTKNKHADTYRFKQDCEKWYGTTIEVITGIGDKYHSIQDVWRNFNSLNTATGAICSTQLKRRVREIWQKENDFDCQVFGFEFDKKEMNRALSLAINHPNTKPVFPLLMFGYDKDDCIKIVKEAGIQIPTSYSLGFRNNNCLTTGCVQGGIGYWQKMKKIFPDKFDAMADMEHELTKSKGEPVTMLKNQSNEAKVKVRDTGIKWKQFVFLKHHPDYPELSSIDDFPEYEVKPLFECNGFCGTNDFTPNETSQEINYSE